MGAWIAFDKFTKGDLEEFVTFTQLMKKQGLLNRLLFSHDAGWFKPEQAGGGEIKGFSDIDKHLIPALLESGITPNDIDQILVKNPAECFKVKKRLIKD